MHDVADHVNTTRNAQEQVSTHPTDPKPLNVPSGNPRQYGDELDRLESSITSLACLHPSWGLLIYTKHNDHTALMH